MNGSALAGLLLSLTLAGADWPTSASPAALPSSTSPSGASRPSLAPVVEVEEEVYRYTDAGNGAGPLWCSGSTCLVRSGGRLFASGLETIPGARPLNNCRWLLFTRDNPAPGWQAVPDPAPDSNRTREPSPLAAFADGRVLLSENPTLNPGPEPEPNGGPARPDILQFQAAAPEAPPERLHPEWSGQPEFREHTYRSLAADGPAGELVLFQNVGYTHAEWTFRDRDGRWSAQGQLPWPTDDVKRDTEAPAADAEPEPIRICYPNVALKDRAVYFFGVSDIIEPNPEWRAFKRELTGRDWDYDFRRLFYTSTPDITREPFGPWVEVASRESTCGWLSPGDLWVGPDGAVHLLWTDRAIDERLRPRFFPDARQRHALEYAVIRGGDGQVLRRATILEANEGTPGLAGSAGRFHVTPEGRLLVVHLAAGTDPDGRPVAENRIVEIDPATGALGTPVRIDFEKPFTSFFTTTVRGGSPPSDVLELLGARQGEPNRIAYARVRLGGSPE